MIRKFIILILSTFLLYSCDYKPIYLNKSDINFSIENVNYKGNNEINNIVDTKLKRYKNNFKQ